MRSLRTALFRQIAVLLLVTIGFVGALTFWSAYGQVGKTYDTELVSAANVLYSLMAEELGQSTPPLPRSVAGNGRLLSTEDRQAFERSERRRMFRVWRDGAPALSSTHVPAIPSRAPTVSGFRTVADAAGNWRVYTMLVPAQRLAIEVGELEQVRWRLIASIAIEIALSLLLLLPAAIALVWLSLGDGLRILRRFSQELQSRSLRELSAVDPARWPAELKPLVNSVNRLFGRLSHSAGVERRFIDEAAHQLRTPLAAIKLQTQMAVRATDRADREAMLERLQESVNRATDLCDRLLTLTRLESTTETSGASDLDAEARQAIADLAAFAALRGVTLAHAGTTAPVQADPLLLRMLAANLIDNAIRHSPKDSEVEVQVVASDAGHRLIVTDAGPGIAPELRERVFARFYRGEQDRGGTGLGLAIVAEAVRVLRAAISLEDRPDRQSGLRVVVTLPQVPAAA